MMGNNYLPILMANLIYNIAPFQYINLQFTTNFLTIIAKFWLPIYIL